MIASNAVICVLFHTGETCDALISIYTFISSNRTRAHLVDLCIKGVEVDEEVNASVCKRGHASAVVRTSRDMVDADSIGTQGLHQ